MDKNQPITRRAALVGALVSSATVAVPIATLMPVPAAAAISSAVHVAADQFAAAFIASVRADEAANAVRRAKGEALRRACLCIRYSYASSSPWERVDYNSPPYLHRKMLAQSFDERLASARARVSTPAANPKARTTAGLLPGEADVLADRKKTTTEANKVFRRYRRIELAHDDEPAWAAATEAGQTLRAARKVLIGLVLNGVTAEETAVISAAFIRAATEVGRWFDLPTSALLAALAGDRERAEEWA